MSNKPTATDIIHFINKQVPIEEALEMECDIEVNSFPAQILCPFHDDVNEPSARVYGGDKGMYCFGCGRTYLPFDFGKLKGMRVGETIRYFKDVYNIEVPEDEELTEGSFKLNNQIAFYTRLIRAYINEEGSLSINQLKKLESALKSSYRMEKLSSSFKKFILEVLNIKIKS